MWKELFSQFHLQDYNFRGGSRKDSLWPALQIYTVENGTHVKSVKVTSICCRYYNLEV